MTMATVTQRETGKKSGKHKTLEDIVKGRELSPEEADAAMRDDALAELESGTVGEKMLGAVGAAQVGGTPDWCPIPSGLKIPPGRQIGFMLFRASWTDAPQKGDRTCVLWSLSEAEEKMAYTRARGDALRSIGELAKQMIRVVDGQRADWTLGVGAGNVDRFWDDIGRKCCQMIQNYYLKTHTLSQEEQQDFFMNCLVVRTAVAG